MNIYNKILEDIKLSLKAVSAAQSWPDELDFSRIDAVPPKDDAHGDIATNAAMVIVSQLRSSSGAVAQTNPKVIAEALVAELKKLPHITKADIAGPGFINITLAPAVWHSVIPVVLSERIGFGNSVLGKNQRVNVEYVSVNPTGPMHVGHARYIYGDALADLLIKAGYSVTKEYYINDAGAQVDKVADSVYLRYREACGEKIGEIPEGLYPGEYLMPIGEALFKIHDHSLLTKERAEWLPIVRDYALEAMMQLIKSDLALLGIHHDVFTSERAITAAGKVEEAMQALAKQGLIYEGVLEAPKGKAPEDWEPRPQTLFKSSAFGDDSDRAVKKSDGSWTYFGPDIAYQFDKINRGFDKLIMLLGVDHGGYVKRLQAAVNALSKGSVELEVKLCQLVKFMRAGEPMKMSKRAGTFITVREVVEEVGKDVFRFIMLTRKNDAPLDFDFDLVKAQTRENPVFYVQYAHARAQSVIRLAAADMPEARVRAKTPDANLLALLNAPEELALIRAMANWPRIVESAAIAAEPHRIAFYLQDLAGAFHALWNKGNDELTLRFLQKDAIDITAARLAMLEAFALTIASGLTVLGVEPIQELR
jgi:arginyl-tRNA synthetase